MIKNWPLVSIVVPSYNHGSYIQRCIESIVHQDYQNYELIVIDDGSLDKSAEILKKLQTQYGFYLEINENQGCSKTLNRGFRDIAKGKYFTFCASDDYWLPGKLSKQVKFLEENPEYAMVFGKAKIVDEFDNLNVKRTEALDSKLIGGWIFRDLINGQFHPPVNYMLRASVVKELGYYREHIWAEDFDMNLRIAYKYPIGFIDDYLFSYRMYNNIPSKSLNFKTIYSHRDSILLFKDTEYFDEAMKLWHFRCFIWYAPFKIGKPLALKGMFKSFSLIFSKKVKQFITSFIVLIVKWH